MDGTTTVAHTRYLNHAQIFFDLQRNKCAAVATSRELRWVQMSSWPGGLPRDNQPTDGPKQSTTHATAATRLIHSSTKKNIRSSSHKNIFFKGVNCLRAHNSQRREILGRTIFVSGNFFAPSRRTPTTRHDPTCPIVRHCLQKMRKIHF